MFSLNSEEKEKAKLLEEEMKLLNSRKNLRGLSFWNIFCKVQNRRNLIILIGLTWGVKLIDWMMFSIWVETSISKGGMGFSSLETGAISLLAFPMVSFVLMACFKITKEGLQTNWLLYCNLAMFTIMIVLPLMNLIDIQHEAVLLLTIVLVSIKEGAFLVWMSVWSHIMTKLVLVYSQIFPRGLTFFIENEELRIYLGDFRFVIYFFLLSMPLIVAMIVTSRIKDHLSRTEGILI